MCFVFTLMSTINYTLQDNLDCNSQTWTELTIKVTM